MKKLFALAAMMMVAVSMMAVTVDECFEKAKQLPGADVTELGSEELAMAAAFMPQMADMFNACKSLRTVDVSDETGEVALELVNCFAGEIDDYEMMDAPGALVWIRTNDAGHITGLLTINQGDNAASATEMVIDMTPDEFATFMEKMGD